MSFTLRIEQAGFIFLAREIQNGELNEYRDESIQRDSTILLFDVYISPSGSKIFERMNDLLDVV